MRILLQFLIPGMEHGEEADFGAEMARIARDFGKFWAQVRNNKS